MGFTGNLYNPFYLPSSPICTSKWMEATVFICHVFFSYGDMEDTKVGCETSAQKSV